MNSMLKAWIILALFSLAIWGVGIAVIIHFVHKFW